LKQFSNDFIEMLRRLFTSRKFILALAAWFTALAGLLSGAITQADFLNATITLVLAVIGGIAVEDAARNFSGGHDVTGGNVVNISTPTAPQEQVKP